MAVHEQEALAHVFRNGGKLVLLPLELRDLGGDGLLLAVEPPQERGELLVGVAVLRVLQIQGQDGPDQVSGQPVGQKNGQGRHHQQNGRHGGDQAQQQVRHGALLTGQAQQRPVLQCHRHIKGPGGKCGGQAAGAAVAGGQRLLDLLPGQVVLHSVLVGLGVIENGSVAADPGQTVGGVQVLQVAYAAQGDALGGQLGLGLQLPEDPLGKMACQRGAEQGGTQDYHRKPHRQDGLRNLFGHEAPPIL